VKLTNVVARRCQETWAINPQSGWQEWSSCPAGYLLQGIKRGNKSSQGLDAIESWMCCQPALVAPVVLTSKPTNYPGGKWTVLHPTEGASGKVIPVGGPVAFKAPDGRILGARYDTEPLYLQLTAIGTSETWRFSH
jgi:hypothetical protein